MKESQKEWEFMRFGIVGALVTGKTVAGWTSMLISIWFIGGAILLSMGVIGEYIGKIYKEVKRRPRYHVEKTI